MMKVNKTKPPKKILKATIKKMNKMPQPKRMIMIQKKKTTRKKTMRKKKKVIR